MEEPAPLLHTLPCYTRSLATPACSPGRIHTYLNGILTCVHIIWLTYVCASTYVCVCIVRLCVYYRHCWTCRKTHCRAKRPKGLLQRCAYGTRHTAAVRCCALRCCVLCLRALHSPRSASCWVPHMRTHIRTRTYGLVWSGGRVMLRVQCCGCGAGQRGGGKHGKGRQSGGRRGRQGQERRGACDRAHLQRRCDI